MEDKSWRCGYCGTAVRSEEGTEGPRGDSSSGQGRRPLMRVIAIVVAAIALFPVVGRMLPPPLRVMSGLAVMGLIVYTAVRVGQSAGSK